MKQAMPDTTADRTIETDREDHVDRLRGQWARELPDIDTEPMAIFGRAKRLSNLLAPSIEETFAGFGLDRGEFDVIATLRRSGPPYQLTPTEMYTTLMLSSGGLTHRLDRLEKAGLIERRKSKLDGRSVVVCLMPAGIEPGGKGVSPGHEKRTEFPAGPHSGRAREPRGAAEKLVLDIEARV